MLHPVRLVCQRTRRPSSPSTATHTRAVALCAAWQRQRSPLLNDCSCTAPTALLTCKSHNCVSSRSSAHVACTHMRMTRRSPPLRTGCTSSGCAMAFSGLSPPTTGVRKPTAKTSARPTALSTRHVFIWPSRGTNAARFARRFTSPRAHSCTVVRVSHVHACKSIKPNNPPAHIQAQAHMHGCAVLHRWSRGT